MSGARHRQKGNRAERAVVRTLQDRGFAAERVPLSGAARGRFGGDVSVPVLGVDRRVEVKCRGNGFRRLYDWLDGADLLILRADRRELLLVLPLKLAAEIAAVAERGRTTFDLTSFLQRQKEFSQRTFGPNDRTQGIIDHIRKEVGEIEQSPPSLALEEWIDIVILALDGALRLNCSPEDIAAALDAKLERNKRRKWPDWRSCSPDRAIEHLVEEDEESDAPTAGGGAP